MLHFLFHSGSSSGTNSSSKESYELLHGLEKPSPEIKDLSFRFVLVQDIGDRKKTILFDSKYSDHEGHETQLRDSSHAPLTDLMFGAIPMSQKNTVTKLHVLQSPSPVTREYMLTQLFQINLCGPVETPGNEMAGEDISSNEQRVNEHTEVNLNTSTIKTQDSTQSDGETAKPRLDDRMDERRSVPSETDEKRVRKESKHSPKRKNNLTTASSSSLLHDQMEKLLSIQPSHKERPRPSRLISYSPRSSSPIRISHSSGSVPDTLSNSNPLLGTRKLNGSSYSFSKETGNLMENMRRRRKNRPPPINLSTSSLNGAGGTLSPFLFSETRTRPSTYALALIVTVPVTFESTVHPLTFYWSLFSNATKNLKTDIDNHIRELLCVSLSNSSNCNENAIPLIQSTSSKVGFGSYSLQKDAFTITKIQQCLRIIKAGVSAPLIQPSVFSNHIWMENIKILEDSCRNEKQKKFIFSLLTLAMKMSRLKKTEKTPCKIMIQSSRAPIARRFLYILAPLLRPSLATSSADMLEPNLLFPSSGMLSSQSMPTTPNYSSNNTRDAYSSSSVSNSSQAIDIRSSKPSNHNVGRKSSLRNYLGSSWRLKFMRSSYQSSPTGPDSSGVVSNSSSKQPEQQHSFGSFSPSSSDFIFGSNSCPGLEYLDNFNANKEALKGLPKTRLVPNGLLQVDLPMIDTNCDSTRTRLPKLGPSVFQAGFLTYLHPCFDLQAAPLDAYIIPNREEFFASTLTSMLETNLTPKKENDTNLYSRIAVANIDECNIQCYELCEVPVMDECPTQDNEDFTPKLNCDIFRETIMTSFNVNHGCFYSLKRSYLLYDYSYVDDEFVNIALAGKLESVFDYINKSYV
ncbi:folliculin-interacting protein, BFC/FNIP-Folliculin complex subunit subunit Fnp1 [Schizosaccharomyces osmophilus]|uniref:Folliculin-interacting protein, BFC/FNIP-Folliculin complex subunit subunit Fnp1 n=1 Tax=Schizosaccharomyces osmophilus TaxID=2545709 RepID=A0AAE9WDR5_9SCHI|nr:folliculin-interacting protein, BFC/FNIP-Folliculin complex subunit subunit Fnp1 [Schizosaccharomyces osmophilus]WBW73356.1 folliculin-interacting protein, BFC/FNIP-Folliculin complex subunit subunit Fnp1 [Schizosaccharomyces osmophilus]